MRMVQAVGPGTNDLSSLEKEIKTEIFAEKSMALVFFTIAAGAIAAPYLIGIASSIGSAAIALTGAVYGLIGATGCLTRKGSFQEALGTVQEVKQMLEKKTPGADILQSIGKSFTRSIREDFNDISVQHMKRDLDEFIASVKPVTVAAPESIPVKEEPPAITTVLKTGVRSLPKLFK